MSCEAGRGSCSPARRPSRGLICLNLHLAAGSHLSVGAGGSFSASDHEWPVWGPTAPAMSYPLSLDMDFIINYTLEYLVSRDKWLPRP